MNFFFIVFCPDLIDPTNGHVTTNGSSVGSIATYSCNAGFVVVGTVNRACQNDGQWNLSSPTCGRMLTF